MAFQYNRLAPLVYGDYNPDDGLFLGGGFISFSHGFRKQPYKQRHLFLASFAPLTQSVNFQYGGRFNEIFGRWSLELDVDLKAPNYVNNFFGLGNESVFNNDIDDEPGLDVDESIQYYRYRFEELRFEVLLSRNLGTSTTFKIGPALQRIEMEKPATGTDRFISEYAATLDYNLFAEYNSFGGAAWELKFEKRNEPVFTKRGVTFLASGRSMAGLNHNTDDFNSFESSLAFLHSFRSEGRLVFAARVGGGMTTGKHAFYQSQILDGKTEIRGYRKTRFYGNEKFFSNFEVRLKLLRFRSYLFPASMGISGFHDIGRVWYKDETGVDPTASDGKSNVWHKGWGGGLWFTPFNLTILSTEMAHSEDGWMGYIRLGFLF
jgi:hypothetical protein